MSFETLSTSSENGTKMKETISDPVNRLSMFLFELFDFKFKFTTQCFFLEVQTISVVLCRTVLYNR
jgi:hypothetical protein